MKSEWDDKQKSHLIYSLALINPSLPSSVKSKHCNVIRNPNPDPNRQRKIEVKQKATTT